jgi:DNA-binding NtrC family response regulator
MTDKESDIEFSKSDYEKAKRKFRIEYFTKLLEQTNNNHTKTAELAGISRTGLDKALKELGMK